MKKAILIITAVMTVLSLVSCKAQHGSDTIPTGAYLDNLTSLQYDSSESPVSVSHRKEIDVSTHRYNDPEAASTITLDIDGVSYNLQYAETERGAYYNDEISKYTVQTDLGECYAKINSVTGECVEWFGIRENLEEGQTPLTHEQQYEIAYQFLTEHVDNANEYRNVFQNGENLWFVYFARYVGEIETYERVEVIVDPTGNIMSYKLEHIGHMNGIDPVPASIVEMAHTELERRGHDIYGVLGDGYTYTLETVIDCLVRLDDGALALKGHVNAKIASDDGADYSDGAWFIIPITEPTQ